MGEVTTLRYLTVASVELRSLYFLSIDGVAIDNAPGEPKNARVLERYDARDLFRIACLKKAASLLAGHRHRLVRTRRGFDVVALVDGARPLLPIEAGQSLRFAVDFVDPRMGNVHQLRLDGTARGSYVLTNSHDNPTDGAVHLTAPLEDHDETRSYRPGETIARNEQRLLATVDVAPGPFDLAHWAEAAQATSASHLQCLSQLDWRDEIAADLGLDAGVDPLAVVELDAERFPEALEDGEGDPTPARYFVRFPAQLSHWRYRLRVPVEDTTGIAAGFETDGGDPKLLVSTTARSVGLFSTGVELFADGRRVPAPTALVAATYEGENTRFVTDIQLNN